MIRSLCLFSCLLAASIIAEEPKETEEPVRLHDLAKAGEVAAQSGNISLMKELLMAGLPIDEPLYADKEGKPGWTALHLSALHNQPAMTKFLLKHGAYRRLRDTFEDRPIDLAFEKGNTELCKLLAIPNTQDEVVEGIPVPLLEEVLLRNSRKMDGIVWISINNDDPAASLLAKCEVFGKGVQPASTMENYVDKKTKQGGHLVQILIQRNSKDITPENPREWSVRISEGPSLAGGGVKGTAQKAYGYWLLKQTSSWDE